MYYFSARPPMPSASAKSNLKQKESKRAENVFGEILESFPHLKNYGKSLLFSVNQEYSDGSENVKDGDELAIFTAVSGG